MEWHSAAANALSSGRDSFGGIALEAAPPVGGGVDRPRIIDLRSDTVTKPTQTMRAAMATAICGDDVFGDDPTVKDLEIVVAAAFGKEAALFVPSGTMGNLIAVGVHCEVRGSEFICGDLSHVHIYEQGGLSTLMGAHPRALKNEDDGTIDLQRIRNAFRSDDQHFPRTTVLCIEQTHNKKGGRVLPLSYVDDCGALCKSLGIQLHVDGARIWNAAIAQGVTPARAVQAADSVSVCLSKGLGAPVGSVIVGSAPFIAKCRRLRKACGGGMRQAGTLAAAAMMALREVWPVMSLDHVRMKRLAAGLQKIPGVEVSSPIETNICFVTFPPTADVGDVVVALKREHEIVVIPWTTPNSIRIVTHHEINDAAVQAVVDGVTRVLANMYRGGR
jgi:threonine aldolase